MTEGMPGMAHKPYRFDDLAEALNVSRETLSALKLYGGLLEEWQNKFNLVSARTIPDMWHRHFLDSAQILDPVTKTRPVWLDFGSGAGFPGLVVAILLWERGGGHVHVVESIGKKARFLQEVVDQVFGPQGERGGVTVTVHRDRVENLDPFKADVISARALASLDKLLGYGHRFAGPDSLFLFPKGQDVDQELTEAAKCWNIDLDKYPSKTDPNGVILRIKNVTKKPVSPKARRGKAGKKGG